MLPARHGALAPSRASGSSRKAANSWRLFAPQGYSRCAVRKGRAGAGAAATKRCWQQSPRLRLEGAQPSQLPCCAPLPRLLQESKAHLPAQGRKPSPRNIKEYEARKCKCLLAAAAAQQGGAGAQASSQVLPAASPRGASPRGTLRAFSPVPAARRCTAYPYPPSGYHSWQPLLPCCPRPFSRPPFCHASASMRARRRRSPFEARAASPAIASRLESCPGPL